LSLYEDPASLLGFDLRFVGTDSEFDINCVMQWVLDPRQLKDCLDVTMLMPEDGSPSTAPTPDVDESIEHVEIAPAGEEIAKTAVTPAAAGEITEVVTPRPSEPVVAPVDSALLHAIDSLEQGRMSTVAGLSAQLQDADGFEREQLALLSAVEGIN
jgi:hypothetical protein